MTENNNTLKESHFVFFEEDFLYQTQELEYALCKPKLLPLKSITLEKLEKMQNEAEAKIKASLECEQEIEESEDTQKSNKSSDEQC